MTLIELGVSEKMACSRVARHFGGDARMLETVWAEVKRRKQRRREKIPQPKIQRTQSCIYCGLREYTGIRKKRYARYRMLPVCDFRGIPVGAHVVCAELEQVAAGGL